MSFEIEDQGKKYLVGVPLVMKKASAWFLVFAQLWGLESTPRIKAQVIRAMVSVSRDPWISEESRERTGAGNGLWCQAQLYRQGSTPEEKEMTMKELLTCFSGEEAGGEEAVGPVSEQRRQEEKGEAAT